MTTVDQDVMTALTRLSALAINSSNLEVRGEFTHERIEDAIALASNLLQVLEGVRVLRGGKP